ncbi:MULTISPECIES: glycosyl hydrolase [Streptomyces]|uniref:Glycosyl hydrolase n=2 Tax=Streptomyces TaxID=1883 RepID=A0ABU4K9H6_9ACTN|nr:glycosyl hydrolase [Streptomyces roseolus]MDX2294372.1 glycosyl hydrolase [Streptomyces roseolus]
MNDDFDFDFDLDELAPADPASADAVERFWSGDLRALTLHHITPDGSRGFVVAHDQSLIWGVPGADQIMAIAVTRDLTRFTFSLETSYHATVAFAQAWLVERGCPPGKIGKLYDDVLKPADDLTVEVEQKIRASGARYEVLDTYTYTDSEPGETWTLTRDSRADEMAIRVFHEEWKENTDTRTHTYTMREGAFTDVASARAWLEDRDGPLPEPPEYRYADGAVLRARAALSRSAGTPAIPKAGVDAPRTPPAAPGRRPAQGRLL